MHGSRSTSRLRWRTLIVALLAAVVGAALAPTTASATDNDNYVALGDSYTAGPLIPNQNQQPLGCLRSDHNYPHVVAPALGLPEFRDASCSGAKTDHMTQPQNVTFGVNPPQFDRLDADTQVVTLGIGGNDIGFSDVVQSCFTLNPFGHPCQDLYVVGGHDEISDRISNTAPKIDDVLQGIHERSSNAAVFVVGYPAILPNTGFGCWPQLPVAYADVPYLRNKELELDAMLANESAANGAVYVDTYTPSIGHDACTLPTVRWVEPLIPANPAAPVHPNARGMEGIAAAVLAAIFGG